MKSFQIKCTNSKSTLFYNNIGEKRWNVAYFLKTPIEFKMIDKMLLH